MRFRAAAVVTALTAWGCVAGGGADPFAGPGDAYTGGAAYVVDYEVVCTVSCTIEYTTPRGSQRLQIDGRWGRRVRFGRNARAEKLRMRIDPDRGHELRRASIRVNGQLRDRVTEGRAGSSAITLRAVLSRE